MSGNPLVAAPVDTSTATSGAGVADDLVGMSDALRSGNWLAIGLSGVGEATMTEHAQAPAELVEADAAATELGFERGVDYGIAFVPATLGSERIDLDVDGAAYVVSYTDKGSAREVLRTDDWSAAREAFLDEVGRLAGPRGRGPRAGEPTAAEQLAASRTMDDAAAEYYRRFGGGES